MVAVLAAGLVVPVSAGPAWAQNPPPAVDYDVDDDGLIEVSSLAQLNAIRWDLDGDGAADVYPADQHGRTGHDPDGATKLAAAFPDAVAGMGCPSDGCVGYELVADLDFDTNANGQADAGDAFWNGGKGWFPLMGGEAIRDEGANERFADHVRTSYLGDRPNPRARMFTGVFEGNGRTIANLFIDDPDRRYVGLFGYVGPGAHVRNVGLPALNSDSEVRGDERVGALAGSVERARVSGAWSDIDVTGTGSNVGGLVGSSWNYSFVIESYAAGDVSGEALVGGLVGMLNGSGAVASYATGSVAARCKGGGFIGQRVVGHVRAAYATGSVTAIGTSVCMARGVLVKSVGGLLGTMWYPLPVDWPRASYAIGRVSAPQGANGVGGLGGRINNPEVPPAEGSNYWDVEASGQTGSPGFGTGFTTAQLQAPTGYTGIYADWNVDVGADGDFGGAGDDPWDFGSSSQYPVLKYCADKPGIDTADGEPYCPLDPVAQRSGGVTIEVVPESSDADTPPPVVVVSVSAASGGTEGTGAVFMLSAVPTPQSGVDVTVAVTASGDFGAAVGSRTVTIGSGGSGSVSVATVDDSVDEADGSVTVTVQPGDGYAVGAVSSLSADVVDDDEPTGSLDDSGDGDGDAAPQGYTVDAAVVAKVEYLASQAHHGSAHVNRWQRVLAAFGVLDAAGVDGGAMTAVQAQQMADTHSSPVWDEVVAELTALEAAQTTQDAPTSQDAPVPAEDDAVPLTVYMIFFSRSIDENGAGYDNQAGLNIGLTRTLRAWETVTVPLSVTGGNEGTNWTMRNLNDPDAVFANEFEVVFGPGDQRVDLALTAVADSDWDDHEITVSYGTGNRAPTLNGSTDGVTLGISWGPDGIERADGSTTVVIVDSDEPPPQIDITAASGGTEGTDAVFTVTASTPAAADLAVNVAVTATGDWGAATGTQTVTIPQGATVATLTVATVDDSTDEPDGTITATLTASSGYEIGAQPTQTAHITDDDDPPPEPAIAACTGKPRVTVADAAAQRGDDLEFVISLSCRSTGKVTVYYFVAYGADISSVRTVNIASGDTDTTVTAPTDGVNTSITFHVVYTIGAANYSATATATITR